MQNFWALDHTISVQLQKLSKVLLHRYPGKPKVGMSACLRDNGDIGSGVNKIHLADLLVLLDRSLLDAIPVHLEIIVTQASCDLDGVFSCS